MKTQILPGVVSTPRQSVKLTPDPNEPLWARFRSDQDIFHVCRGLGVQENQLHGLNRDQLIQRCDYLNLFPQLKLPENRKTLQQKCANARGLDVTNAAEYAKINGLNEDQLIDCIVNARAERFRSILGVETVEQTEKEILKLQLPDDVAADMVAGNAQGQSELMDSTVQISKVQEKPMLLMTKSMLQSLAAELYSQIRIDSSYERETDQIEKTRSDVNRTQPNVAAFEEREDQSNQPAWWRIVKYIGRAAKYMFNKAFDFIKYIVEHPMVANLGLTIAGALVREWCRDLAISFGRYNIGEDKNLTQLVVDASKTGIGVSKQLLFVSFQELINGANFDDLWSLLESSVSVTFTFVTGGLSTLFLPLASFGILMSKSLKVAVRKGSETFVYYTLVQSNFNLLRDIGIDLTHCFANQYLTCSEAKERDIDISTMDKCSSENNQSYRNPDSLMNLYYLFYPPESIRSSNPAPNKSRSRRSRRSKSRNRRKSRSMIRSRKRYNMRFF